MLPGCCKWIVSVRLAPPFPAFPIGSCWYLSVCMCVYVCVCVYDCCTILYAVLPTSNRFPHVPPPFPVVSPSILAVALFAAHFVRFLQFYQLRSIQFRLVVGVIVAAQGTLVVAVTADAVQLRVTVGVLTAVATVRCGRVRGA